jgi:hypothetical protein
MQQKHVEGMTLLIDPPYAYDFSLRGSPYEHYTVMIKN